MYVRLHLWRAENRLRSKAHVLHNVSSITFVRGQTGHIYLYRLGSPHVLAGSTDCVWLHAGSNNARTVTFPTTDVPLQNTCGRCSITEHV